jgi:4-hydroxy-3-polyprenylbenzoate decarboxylase
MRFGDDARRRLIVAITGATGVALGVRILELLADRPEIETHLVISQWGRVTIRTECDRSVAEIERLADFVHGPRDQAAPISSGSFTTDGMIVAPCTMKTLAEIGHGLSDGLIARAADVVLKERRKLVLLAREMPLSATHLKNMLAVSELGAVVLPPMLTFYNSPENIGDLVDHVAQRTLDQFGITVTAAPRWNGLPRREKSAQANSPERAGRAF